MNKVRNLIMGIIIILISILTGCLYEPDEEVLSHFIVSENYSVIDVSCDIVSGSECMWFVSISIQNKKDNEIIDLNGFSYDLCEDELYYGWKYGNDKKILDSKYGIIT